jgi:ketosteroid isomerase-like protein
MSHHALAAIAIVAGIGAWACANPPGPQPNAAPATVASPAEDVSAVIVQNEKDWVAAITRKDAAALDRLLADDFVGTSPTAHTYTRTNAIDDLKNGRYIVEAMMLGEVSVNVYGNTAVSFTSQEEKSQYAGVDTSGHYHLTDVWVKKDGRWQAVASHGTRYDKLATNENGQ